MPLNYVGKPYLTVTSLLALWREYCEWNWQKTIKDGAPIPENNHVSFIAFMDWVDNRLSEPEEEV